jgi:hypothetical protein
MEKKIFKTLVTRGVQPRYDNDFVLGKIAGIQRAICNPTDEQEFACRHKDTGVVFTTECTEEEYKQFTEIVERTYPGLCKFLG